jgi:cold shock CspA family protein/ribosome-associated translation inhibitor RaiA
MELHIDAQHANLEPEMRAWITQRLGDFNTPHQDIIHARVTLVKQTHHQHGSDEARVFLTLPGKTLSATCRGATLESALSQVMDVMTRELHDFRSRRQGTVKTPGPRLRGHIVRLFAERDYGFIEAETHGDVYFHAHAVHGLPFEQLRVGMSVDLDIEAGHAGPQATRVTPHHLA